jgi:hypothetical protein
LPRACLFRFSDCASLLLLAQGTTHVGKIYDVLRARVARDLLPGEQPNGFAFARRPTRFTIIGVPEDRYYEDFLIVTTPSRILMYRSSHGMMGGPTEDVRGDAIVWWFDEIAQVDVGDVKGIRLGNGGYAKFFTLKPHPGCGPFEGTLERYDLNGLADGLDEQQKICNTFGPWLAGEIARGAYPLPPEKRAAIDARIAQKRADGARRVAEQAAKQERIIKAATPIVIRVGIGIAVFIPFAIASSVSLNGWSRFSSTSTDSYDKRIALMQHDKAAVSAGKHPTEDCSSSATSCRMCEFGYDQHGAEHVFIPEPATKLPGTSYVKGWDCPKPAAYDRVIAGIEHERDEVGSSKIGYLVAGIVGGFFALVFAAAGAGLFIWDRKKKRVGAAAGATRDAMPERA